MQQTNSAPAGGGMLTGTNATPGVSSNLIMQTSYQKQSQQPPMMNKMLEGAFGGKVIGAGGLMPQ